MRKQERMSARAVLLQQYLEEFKQGVQTEDDYLQFSAINKYIKKEGIDTLPEEIQARYCRLLRLKGLEKRSIELLEKIYDENNHCSSWEIRWELLSDYLYIDDYDKVEALIADWFYDKHPNNKEPMLQTILDEYRHRNLVLACMVLAKEKYHLSLKTKPSRQISYYEQQMKDYNLKKAKAYNQHYFYHDANHYQFNLNLTVDGVFDMAKKLLPSAIKSTNSYVVDFYYFDFDKPIGQDLNHHPLTGIKVTTLKNSQNILFVIPYDVKSQKKFRVINSVQTIEKENNPVKTKNMSQIEKFNRRYQNN